jgi:hypothetical protein
MVFRWCRRFYPGIVLCSASFIAPTLRAELHPFTISGIDCRQVTCRATEGLQPGLTVLDIEGRGFAQWANRALRFQVARVLAPGKYETVIEQKVGVFSDGHLTASIAVYKLADGAYDFVFVTPENQKAYAAMGKFLKSSTANANAPASTPAGADMAGEWWGINGTAGQIVIRSDGSYLWSGKPGGHVKRSGDQLQFDGALAAWDGGRASIKRDVIEFYWTTASGAKQYFVFGKEK